MIAPATIALRGLSVLYDGIPAVADVTCDLAPGKLIGLIGPNGAGKTTLVRACAGLVEAGAGDINLGGTPLGAWPRRERARLIGYLAQDRAVQWPLTVGRVVALGRLPHLGPWDDIQPRDADSIAKAMTAADVTHLAARPVTNLSGGELTRVLIARVLAGTPQILLADEPISGLDPAHRLKVLEIFRALSRAGHTVVVVLHDLTLAARYCDRLVLMDQGKIVADGPPVDVLTPQTLSRYYGVSATIAMHDGELMVVPWDLQPESR
jgi:iron complex transport system ATP-binding protein